MKPPPRTRTKPKRSLKPELVTLAQRSCKMTCKWQRAEQRKLLDALKRLRRIAGAHSDLDYAFLRKYVLSRSISEIQSVVESLKDKVISFASFKLKRKKWEEKKVIKPIEMWTHMASAVAGSLEESISSAFSQMLIVSSTEPRTLRNCDPPQVQRPPTDKDRPIGCTIPFRPMPHSPVQDERPGINTAWSLLVLKTPAPTMGPARRLSAPCQVVRVPNSNIPPQQQPSLTAGASLAATSTSQAAAASYQLGTAERFIVPSTSLQTTPQIVKAVTGHISPSSRRLAVVKTKRNCSSVIQTTQQPSEKQPTSICTSSTTKSVSPCPQMPLSSSIASLTPVPKDSPRTFGVKSVVDFERIYHYLSVTHKPNKDCHLTPMESAIVLDLLMFLPEELSLLDCNKLHKHLLQVYHCLSSPADSRITREMFKDLKDGLSAQTDAQRGGEERKQHTAGTADSSDVMDSGGKKLQPNGAEKQGASGNTFSHLVDAEIIGCCPPLNPFMVPLKLLMRR